MELTELQKGILGWMNTPWMRLAMRLKRFGMTRWISKFIWRRNSGVCDLCGIYAGFDSVIWKLGFTCWKCHDERK